VDEKDCPKCGEDNPEEAVMCWACYTPLGAPAPISEPPQRLIDLNVLFGAFLAPWRPTSRKSSVAYPMPIDLADAAAHDTPFIPTKICVNCDELNVPDEARCWACHRSLEAARVVALAATPTIEICCHRCGEPNWEFSHHCFACKAELHQPVAIPATPMLLIGVGLIGASGWISSPYRWIALTIGMLIAFSLLDAARQYVVNSRRGAKISLEVPPDVELTTWDVPDSEPITRIANTILLYAAKDKATAVLVEKNARGVSVKYQVDGEWREQMKVPIYVWLPLREHLKLRAASGLLEGRGKASATHSGEFHFSLAGARYGAALEYMRSDPLERIELHLTSNQAL